MLAVDLLTMDHSASWWDCGEFITTSYLLEVGHPPGAPTYQLLAHLFTLFAFGNPMLVAPLSNLLSVVATALTAMVLFRTLCDWRPAPPGGATRTGWHAWVGPAVGALCYGLCHTVWFSAVESEVYALAMLVAATQVWLAVRWRHRGGAWRLALIALLAGLGVGVHLLTLLALPAAAFLVVGTLRRQRPRASVRPLVPLCVLFFLLGLSTFAVIPIRAGAHPPINEGDPSTAEAFAAYLRRDQYPKAPLYPRRWRDRDTANHALWDHGIEGPAGEAVYYLSYQLTDMYLRYIVDNFVARVNQHSGRTVVYVLPLLLALLGIAAQWRERRTLAVATWLLFLFGGPLLNLYLNHPCYEPRERDYAYVLSFYAIAMWTAEGATAAARWAAAHRRWRAPAALLLALVPVTLAAGNWSDHDRSSCHSVHDLSLAHLQSCDNGALLFTLGDNDTFPLWYLQQVEHRRTDVSVVNLNLTGLTACRAMMDTAARPVYFTHYAHEALGRYYGRHWRCEGLAWQRVASEAEAADTAPLMRHRQDSIRFHITPHEYLDPVSQSLLAAWDANTAPVAE